ncbi:unnamed protein product [Schistocephalus solidus]|uniref:Uncharacterized protein n=1 Tax=Schistocephalus solidus TaxID=70667 RepID=A0A3P7C228_SCHSO|nr:unnamed protein product [Schistocephalus solidus]
MKEGDENSAHAKRLGDLAMQLLRDSSDVGLDQGQYHCYREVGDEERAQTTSAIVLGWLGIPLRCFHS